jgi:hypothetical protein
LQNCRRGDNRKPTEFGAVGARHAV